MDPTRELVPKNTARPLQSGRVSLFQVGKQQGDVMTWRTQRGERTLTGAEAILIRATIAYVVDIIEDDISVSEDQWDFGVSVFDRLESPSRLAMLAEVSWPLLRDTDSCPPLTELNEATIAALFRAIEQQIEYEIDCEDDMETPFYWRRLLLDVFIEDGGESELPDVGCRDCKEWGLLVETLSDWILWDNDFESGEYFLDTPPEHAETMRSVFGIDDEYYRAIPPDPKECDLPAIRATLRQLCAE